ncbi:MULTISPECIES: hypothetical protein [unclassified Sulfuricurvum]|uniref:hypothetical protein n=1 Tax=unclassified Sulfuricurvum TaxID=2632390 RepID=UPI0008BD3362|nr:MULTISPECIES: hypothetical protein [unclassified Sulfuricurvum]OHD85611.1 MAG: hypothetical protein A3I60_05745 [Sulfuricurvum sp. RIFCSPLOWO2_02_FULL_43_45]OHD89786.1 MAG: hypothetical protein A3G19_01575 [Sulfuricurvum sp. RIFCSPLOWO2_12_FULL_43_24]HBM36595.1 hypothetical protein [Sulfuricurvum sp.]
MQYRSLSFRAFLSALIIHLLIIIILVSQFERDKKNKHYKEPPKILISLKNPYIQSSPIAVESPPESIHYLKQKSPSNESKKIPIVEKKSVSPEINTEPEVHNEVSMAPIVPIERVAGLIKRHYGDMFADLTPEEQSYIVENIVKIHRIDRRVGNALLADKEANLFKDGDSNYVEMYLYPNGTVSDITLINDKANPALDQLTMETIEQSYAQYPRPKQKTLIRLHTRIQRGR